MSCTTGQRGKVSKTRHIIPIASPLRRSAHAHDITSDEPSPVSRAPGWTDACALPGQAEPVLFQAAELCGNALVSIISREKTGRVTRRWSRRVAVAVSLPHIANADRNGPRNAVGTHARHVRQSEAPGAQALPESCLSWLLAQAGRPELRTSPGLLRGSHMAQESVETSPSGTPADNNETCQLPNSGVKFSKQPSVSVCFHLCNPMNLLRD